MSAGLLFAIALGPKALTRSASSLLFASGDAPPGDRSFLARLRAGPSHASPRPASRRRSRAPFPHAGRRPGAVPPRKPALQTLAILFELALGLSAWKERGNARWALRCNSSSSNLHPTEGYAAVPGLPLPLPRPQGPWAGRVNPLSRRHVRWQPVFDAADAKPRWTHGPGPPFAPPLLPLAARAEPVPAAERGGPGRAYGNRRRSHPRYAGPAAATAGVAAVGPAAVATAGPPRDPRPPGAGGPPAPVNVPGRPAILARPGRGLAPGLYLLPRDMAALDALRAACNP